ncbi:MAG: hypothetical protein CM1200mP10_08500 [Candidatus Neomarinimicrobiota bacterium]|nr:MAG: hypothetical protein CM1200mP10_08500 [Candidatus Neomarinimicrobiota bacterium]
MASLLTTFGFLGIFLNYKSWMGNTRNFWRSLSSFISRASAIVRLATMSDLLIVMVGLVLLVVEAFLIPGFGIAGVAGIGVILWGLYLLLLPDVPVSEEVYHSALTGLTIGLLVELSH